MPAKGLLLLFNLCFRQIALADILIINKADLVTDEEITSLESHIRCVRVLFL